MTEIAMSWVQGANFKRTTKVVQCIALLITAGFLFRSGMVAGLSNLFERNPNQTAVIWSNVDTILALLLIPTSFAVLTRLRAATLVAIAFATAAFSAYAAQGLLLVVDRFSDQTFILLNPYLKNVNSILPLLISLVALTASIFRLKTYQPA